MAIYSMDIYSTAENNSGHNFTKMIFSFMMFLLNHLSFIMFLQGWIQHDLLRGGGGALPALVLSCVGLHYFKVLLDYSIGIGIVVHSSLIIILLFRLLYLILSLFALS